MKWFFVKPLFFLLLPFSFCYGQKNADEKNLLMNLKQAKYDTAIIVALVNLCNYYRNRIGEIKKAIPYALRVLKYRKIYGDKKLISLTLDFIGEAYLNNNDYPNACKYWIQSLLLKEQLNDTSKVVLDIYHNIALIYLLRNDFSKSEKFYRKAIKISNKQNNKPYEAKGYLMLGRVYQRRFIWKKAEECFFKSLNLTSTGGQLYDAGIALNAIGGLYCDKDDFAEGLTYFFQSLKLAEDINNLPLTVVNMNDITIALQANEDYEEAIQYLLKAKQKYLKNDYILTGILGNIGTIYMSQAKYEIAIKSINESLDLASSIGNADFFATNYSNLGYIYIAKKLYDSAFFFLQKSLDLSKSLNDELMNARNYMHLGKFYLQLFKDKDKKSHYPVNLLKFSPTNFLKQAEKYLNHSILICKRIRKLSLLRENYRIFSEVKYNLYDRKGALESYDKYLSYRDSVFSIDKAKQINKMQLQYQFDKKFAEKDKELALSKLSAKYKLRLYIYIVSAILFLFSIAFFFKRRIERNKHLLQVASLRQLALNAQMSDHFIGNTMDTINQFIKKNDKDKASEYLGKFSKLIRKVLENASEKLVTLKDDLEMLKDYIELEKLRFPCDGLQYEIIIDENISINNILVPPMVFQILAENSIKHGFEKNGHGKLIIKVVKKRDYLECLVKDNGIGRGAFSTDKQDLIKDRRPIGGNLAEKLIKVANSGQFNTSYRIIDLFTEEQIPRGTAVVFTLPYIVVD